ncbi:MAG TPA: hypothetical protein VER33_15690 [Polyangiaceae bacterium]|nr:hypothetical protein [Polyangiaceae bacterium]
MRDPKRLLRGGGTGLERQLLQAVARERPSPALTRRMQGAIGVGASLIGFKAAASLLAQLAVVTLIATGMGDSSHEPRPAVPLQTLPGTPLGVAPPAPPVEGGLAGSAQPSSAQPSSPESPASEGEAARSPAPSPTSARAPRVPSRPGAGAASREDLRDEIRLLDRARAALESNEPRRALAELTRYRERFPGGAFQQEASVLRVEALSRSGQQARAASLAREFVSRHPDSPHVDRVRGVSSATSKPPR